MLRAPHPMGESSDTSVGVVPKRDPGIPARFRSLDLGGEAGGGRPRKRRRAGSGRHGHARATASLLGAFSAPPALLAHRRGLLDDDTAHAAGVLLAMANSPVSSERREAERKVRGGWER